MFSSHTMPIRGDFIRRGTDETDESTLSSGLPTPADEEVLQPFDRLVLHDPAFNNELASCNEFSTKDNESAVLPKSKSLSKAVMKAKQFAQYLAKSNRLSKKSKSISDLALARAVPALAPAPAPIEDSPCPPAITIPTPPEDNYIPNETKAIFTQTNPPIEQPNLNFTTDVVNQLSLADADTYIALETPPVTSPLLAHTNCLPLESATWSLTLHDAQAVCTKLLLFLPWCALVGGAIILFPTHLEPVAFGPWPGYHVSPGTPSPKGIRRFALWADCAQQHVAIFLAALAALAWWDFSLGLFAGAAVLAQFMHAWGDFRLDRSVLLGEDDRQTIYMVCMTGGLEDGVGVKLAEGGYLAVQDDGGDGTVADEE